MVGGGGQVEFYTFKRGGAEKSFTRAEGGRGHERF